MKKFIAAALALAFVAAGCSKQGGTQTGTTTTTTTTTTASGGGPASGNTPPEINTSTAESNSWT